MCVTFLSWRLGQPQRHSAGRNSWRALQSPAVTSHPQVHSTWSSTWKKQSLRMSGPAVPFLYTRVTQFLTTWWSRPGNRKYSSALFFFKIYISNFSKPFRTHSATKLSIVFRSFELFRVRFGVKKYNFDADFESVFEKRSNTKTTSYEHKSIGIMYYFTFLVLCEKNSRSYNFFQWTFLVTLHFYTQSFPNE